MKKMSHSSALFRGIVALIALLPIGASCSSLEAEKPFAELRNLDGSSTMRFAAYMQARAEFGDLVVGAGQSVRNSEFDLYFRKVSFGIYGNALSRDLKYGLTFSGDQTPQATVTPTFSEENGVALNDTFLQYFYTASDFIKFGKGKFPLSRTYLVSSTKQLFAERPYYVYDWQNILNSYAATNLSVGGKAFRSTVSYNFSISKTWRYGDDLYKDEGIKVSRSSPFVAARLDWSPNQWKENEFSDTLMGSGRSFSAGSYVAYQGIDYSITESSGGAESRMLYGANMSSHVKNFTLQLEVNGTRVASDIQGRDKVSRGLLLQGGYLFPSKIEPVLRYEFYDSNMNIPKSAIQTVTYGVNKYFNGNNLKFGVNVEHSKLEDNFSIQRPAGGATKNVVRATLQFVL